MNPTRHRAAKTIAAAFLLVLASRLGAQGTSASPAGSDAGDASEETIVLSPFVVDAAEDADSYAARSTMAGTRIRTELKDVGSSISVVTQKFLQDTNSTSAEKLLVYTPSTEVAGQGGNFLGKGDGPLLTGTTTDLNPVTRVRGLAEAQNTRDFFLTDIPWDSYNVGRVDLQRGPNAILFGIGKPSGIINSSIQGAAFTNTGNVSAAFGSFGSSRYTLDVNRMLLRDELALRVSLLRDDTKYRQDPAFRDDHRVFAAARWEPRFLNRGSSKTSFRATFEKGDIESNLPRNTPPLDAISLWYDVLDRNVYDPNQVTLGMRSATPGLGGVGSNTSNAAVITFSPDGAQGISYMQHGGDLPLAYYYQPVGVGTYDSFANRSKLPGHDFGAWKARSLTDASIFDFYNHLLEGPNKGEFNEFEAFNLAVSQTFFNDKLGVEAAYDSQDSYTGGHSYVDARAASVSLNILTNIPFGDPNPDLLRPMFASHGGYGEWSDRSRKVWRVTAFGELDFATVAGKDSGLAKILGRNVFTGLLTSQKVDSLYAGYKGYHTTNPFISRNSNDDIHTADFYTDDLFFYNYLGAPIPASRTSASGLRLQGLKGEAMPQSASILAYNFATDTVVPVPMPVADNVHASDRAKLYRSGAKSSDVIDSKAMVWQGYWFGGNVVPMFGYRSDKQSFRNAGGPPIYGDRGQYRDIWSPDWTLPEASAGTKVNSKTFSIVTHLPERWRDNLPGRMNVSLIYNQSENFEPGAGRRDVYGSQVADPSGKTKEYGVAFTGFNDRVSVKLVKYDTKVRNATLGDSISTEYWYIGLTDNWGQWRAAQTRDLAGVPGTIAERIYGYASDGGAVTWMPDGAPKATYSQAELDSTYARQVAAVEDWFRPENQLPQAFVDYWELYYYNDPGIGSLGWPDSGATPGGLQVTGDTFSKGYELELVANPIDGLNVSFNLSKTDARRANLASSFVDFIESRWEVFQGPAGDIRYWGTSDPVLGELPATDDRDDPVNGVAHGSDGWTARGHFRRSVMSGYWLFRALEESSVPELRPWAFNAVADYAFQQGALRGVNVGGSYRWQDRNVIGFPLNPAVDGEYDVTRPYKGSTQGTADFWIGYRKKFGERYTWRTQLNIRNVFAGDDLVKVTVNPDGSAAAYRIPEPRTWTITNTLEF